MSPDVVEISYFCARKPIMKHYLTRLPLVFILYTAVFAVLRLMFIAVCAGALGIGSITDALSAVWHGLPMDMSVAGYLSVVPGILFIVMAWSSRRWPAVTLDIYYGVTAAVIGLVSVLDAVLYGYWGFRIDMTPVFYFTTSPSSALASATATEIVTGVLGCIAVSAGVFWIMHAATGRPVVPPRRLRGWAAASVAVMVAALIIPIRGSVTVSTMNPSRAYFSPRRGLNHAAINPVFNLLYSATHQNDFASQYHFTDGETARTILDAAMSPVAVPTDSTATPLLASGVTRPDIVLVILESFSSHLMPSLGGQPVATGLDSIALDGLMFTDIYASSFRTDRSMPAIFSGLPGQPSTSFMKYTTKVENIASFPAVLADAGYEMDYYYGGDINFTNQLAYLRSMRFGRVVSDRDFSLGEKASKWGAPDHLLFRHALADMDGTSGKGPRLTVIQTSSSHEPFEVPFSSPRWKDIPQANAFAYTDSCVTAFINTLSRSPRWDNTLVVMIPDHYGAWPRDLEPMPERHKVPLIISGGALGRRNERIGVIGNQTDIAATLLSALGLPADGMPFSRDLLAPDAPSIAFMTEPSTVSVVTPDGYLTWNCDSRSVEDSDLSDDRRRWAVAAAGAFLQRLYTFISEL